MKSKIIEKNPKYPVYMRLEYRGVNFTVEYDQDAESPDHCENDDCFIVADYRDFTTVKQALDIDYIRETIEKKKKMFVDGYWIFPVSIYNHSGIALSLCSTFVQDYGGWDTTHGRAFACVKRQKGWTYTREQAIKIAQSLVEEWDLYFEGSVFGYSIDEEFLDESCWGYFGDNADYCISEAESIIDGYIERTEAEQLKRHIAKRKSQIKGHAPLSVRKEFKLKIG